MRVINQLILMNGLKVGKNFKPVSLTLFVNWAVKPVTMYAISVFFVGRAHPGVRRPGRC